MSPTNNGKPDYINLEAPGEFNFTLIKILKVFSLFNVRGKVAN